MSTDIKLSKGQLSKIFQSVIHLNKTGNLGKKTLYDFAVS